MNAESASPESRHAVDPPHLVVTSYTALPQRCFVTNEPISELEYQIWDLPRIPRWLFTLAFVSPFLLITAPFVRDRCKLKAGLSRKVRRKRLLVNSALVFAILTPIWAVVAALVTRQPIFVLLAVAGVVFAQFGLPVLILLRPPLRVDRHEGDLFWIRGCSAEFLASVAAKS